jgi:hypothetical protein
MKTMILTKAVTPVAPTTEAETSLLSRGLPRKVVASNDSGVSIIRCLQDKLELLDLDMSRTLETSEDSGSFSRCSEQSTLHDHDHFECTKELFAAEKTYFASRRESVEKPSRVLTTQNKPFCDLVNTLDYVGLLFHENCGRDERKPSCSAVSLLNATTKRDRRPYAHVRHCQPNTKESNTKNRITCKGTEKKATSIFDRLHDCSREKHLEGKKRREEIIRKQRLNALNRSGAMRKQVKKVSAERGSEVYYRGMMHLLKKERMLAAQHAKVAGKDEPFETKLNVRQMYDYYLILKNSPAEE